MRRRVKPTDLSWASLAHLCAVVEPVCLLGLVVRFRSVGFGGSVP